MSISSAIFAWSSKLMVRSDSMGPDVSTKGVLNKKKIYGEAESVEVEEGAEM